ncbi:ferritin-like domain-containing protein [Hymenobacter negativus]|uniref:Ferritin-like domain-containing protein n=1 Tax=Hymenobacter negativus TaxID=2795026 RepID=A0ABS3QC76_9BACT|nr:ferritin-like domain-containing protein [Hymenobacter negativus]MBO2008573.1 ferritin-like domain-containing protein [Hymenobacter negativus]
MHNQSNSPVAPTAAAGGLLTTVARRSFLRYTGASLAVGGLLLTGCSDDDDDIVDPTANFTDVGSDDFGILNYAYALEQLEAAFYAQVVAGGAGTFFAGATAAEKAILTDIRDHEAIHAAFFKAALGAKALPARVPDFSSIDFNVRTAPNAAKIGVLDAAKAFEDLGVAAYNGAGRFVQDANNLALAGKIVSVEARHAAAIRELLSPNTFVFSDVVDIDPNSGTGMERSKRPPQVLEIANKYLAEGSKLRAPSFA